MKKLALAVGLLALLSVSGFASEVLVNGGFEGGLSPWYTARTQFCFGTCVNWSTTTANVHSGSFSATDIGNIELRQDFSPVAGSSVTGASFWINSTAGVAAFDFFYTDSSDEENVVFFNPGVWTFEDITSYVNTSKTLSGISIWGASPDFVAYIDDASIQAGPAVPEPGTLVMLGSGLVALAGAVRRKL